VIPHDETITENGRTIRIRRDVIVEAVDVERHTSGIDPFTGDKKFRIPEEHQVDPETEQPIFHRYIAGTRIPIKWPWEEKEVAETETNHTEPEAEDSKGVRGLLRKANPISWFKGDKKQDSPALVDAKPIEKEETYKPDEVTAGEPRQIPPEYDGDTKRNLVELDDNDRAMFVPTLVNEPMPPTVINELVDPYAPIKSRSDLTEDDKKAHYARMDALREAKDQERQQRINSMKTPMQIRWELQQAKKEKYDPKAPPPPSKDLLLALGKHMAANGKSVDKEAARRARLHASRVQAREAASREAGELTA
jgi:large subunit ribosomal protein L24